MLNETIEIRHMRVMATLTVDDSDLSVTNSKNGLGHEPGVIVGGPSWHLAKELQALRKSTEYVATTTFTVAEILMAHVLAGGIKDEKFIEPYANLKAYRDRCLARPAWQRTIDRYNKNVEPG